MDGGFKAREAQPHPNQIWVPPRIHVMSQKATIKWSDHFNPFILWQKPYTNFKVQSTEILFTKFWPKRLLKARSNKAYCWTLFPFIQNILVNLTPQGLNLSLLSPSMHPWEGGMGRCGINSHNLMKPSFWHHSSVKSKEQKCSLSTAMVPSARPAGQPEPGGGGYSTFILV